MKNARRDSVRWEIADTRFPDIGAQYHEAMEKDKYEVVSIGIDKQGRWFFDEGGLLLDPRERSHVISRQNSNPMAVLPGTTPTPMIRTSTGRALGKVDVVFPVLHGPFGEDGTVQGLLKLANVPFVGAGVVGSAVGMDKDVVKRLLRDAGIPVAKFLVFDRSEIRKINFAGVKRALRSPFFVKPANLGSSVGISKVRTNKQFRGALKEAFLYDNKIVIEENIPGREIECSVLGNDNPIVSLPGEIITHHEFYSYDAKYHDEKGAQLVIPAGLSKSIVKVQEMVVTILKILIC
jgi:D-alanine-D-alanine ligase